MLDSDKKHIVQLSPTHVILLSFLLFIFSAFFLLSLPIAQKIAVSTINTFFTAVSIATGTGLLTVPIDYFSTFGLCIIMLIVQINTIGLILLTIFLLQSFANIKQQSVKKLVIGNVLNIQHMGNFKKKALFVVAITLLIESITALSLFPVFSENYNNSYAWFLSIFHAITSFGNTGIALFSDSLANFNTNIRLLNTLTLNMALGTIGFAALWDFLTQLKGYIQHKKVKISFNTKIILVTTLVLFFTGSFTLYCLEKNIAFAGMPITTKITNAIFNSIAFMGTGFHTMDVKSLSFASILIVMILAFIGTSPGSTGSGIKTTTAAIFFATLYTVITGKKQTTLFNIPIPQEQIRKAVAIITLSIGWVLFGTFLLTIYERDKSFIALLFESVSAFSTLGMSMNVTQNLTDFSKYLLTISMILGRIGPLTLIFNFRNIFFQKATYN